MVRVVLLPAAQVETVASLMGYTPPPAGARAASVEPSAPAATDGAPPSGVVHKQLPRQDSFGRVLELRGLGLQRHAGRDTASGIGPGMVPTQDSSQRASDYYQGINADMDTADGFESGMQIREDYPQVRPPSQERFRGRDTASALGEGFVPRESADRSDAKWDAPPPSRGSRPTIRIGRGTLYLGTNAFVASAASVGVTHRLSCLMTAEQEDQWRAFTCGVVGAGLPELTFTTERDRDGVLVGHCPLVDAEAWPRRRSSTTA